jgi:serine/threonine protein kinase
LLTTLRAGRVSTTPKKQPIPFGKYLLLDRVNIGGMAEVWRAKAFGVGGFERLLAIKKILPNIAEDQEFITMFIDEAKISIQLNHGNIGKIEDLANIAGAYVIAMEYISGKDLRAVFDRCRKRGEPAPIPLTCHVIAQCCEGLDYAHRAKDKSGRDMHIVHRDVSPQNALISYDGEVKVIDFGIAKAAGKMAQTQAGILKGKFGYMSPEQIRGLPLDRRSDIFAVGVCLYELLTGERLFVGESDFSVLEKVRKVEVIPPSHFNRRIAEPLERIVMKALAKDVDDRFQYASELAEALRGYMYSTGNPFSRKDLSAFMRATFAEDHEAERLRLQGYAEIKAPEGLLGQAEPGYGVGVFPSEAGFAPGGSAATNIPSQAPVHHAPVLQITPAENGLPAMVRPLPPVLAPPSGAATRPMPAPLPQRDEQTTLRSLPLLAPAPIPLTAESPTPPAAGGPAAPSAPRPSVALPPPTAPAQAPEPSPGSNTTLILVLVGIVALIVTGVVAAVLLKPPTTGILVVSVPPELRATAEVSINGEPVDGKNCSPPREWPLVCQVKVGKAVVRIAAPGHEAAVDTVEVRDGEPVELQKSLKKAGN